MNSIFLTAVSLTLSGSLLALAVLLIQKVSGARFSQRWHYYIWLAVVLRLLLPVSLPVNLTGLLLRQTGAETGARPGTEMEAALGEQWDAGLAADGEGAPPAQEAHPLQGLTGYLWVIWVAGAGILLVKKITGYRAFVQYVGIGSSPVEDDRLIDAYFKVCEQMGIRRAPGLYGNPLMAAPMLVGVFRPFIVLPELPEEGADIEQVLRHELTHYRRGDIFYKWLVQLTVCLHWFNPLAYRMIREINARCELACDEAVARELDQEGRYRYGETLLSTIRPGKGYSSSVVSVTLNEDSEKIKERLDAIMNYKKRSRASAVLAVVAAGILLAGGSCLGVYAAAPQAEQGSEVVSDYLRQSASWRDFAARGENTHKEWPRYYAASFESLYSDAFGESVIVEAAMTLTVTVERRAGKLDLWIAGPDSDNRVLNLENAQTGQHTVALTQPGVYNILCASTEKRFAGNILVEGQTAAKSRPAGEGPMSSYQMKAAIYDDPAAIAAASDGYMEVNRGFWTEYIGDTGYAIKAGQMVGCKTLFQFAVEEACTVSVDFDATVSGGRCKLVYVGPDGAVKVLSESTIDGGIGCSETVRLTRGVSSLKIVTDGADVDMLLQIGGDKAVKTATLLK